MINYCIPSNQKPRLFQYPNTYSLRNSNGGRQTSASFRQSLKSYSEDYLTSSSILQSFPNIY